MKNKTILRQTVYTALFAALAFVATVVIHIHIPTPGATGYINFGDCVVLTCGIVLGHLYGGLAAGIGSAMADAYYGHMIYVPGTFVIKALMAVSACFVYRLLSKNKDEYKIVPLTAACVVGEVVMVAGYLLYETALPGIHFAAAFLGVPGNCIQGIAGIVLGVLVLQIMKKTRLTDMIKFK